jgi:catechol 2,3-dioxygenase-like lactoylglutathione lyase family enzyme
MNSPAVPAQSPMQAHGTTASNVFFYYEDVDAASEFYQRVLGLRLAADYGFAKIVQVAPKSFITLVDHEHGMHGSDEPKTVAIALVTDQLEDWWRYLQTQDIDMRSKEFAVKAGSAHDGFVAIDPEGYLLEFERFNEHAENVRFLPLLDALDDLTVQRDSGVPTNLGFKATVIWFYYKDMARMQQFYERDLGLELIADQGWAKIYPIGPSGFFGLVDEQRGMHRFTEEKAVTLSFITGDIDGWFAAMHRNPEVKMRSGELSDTERYRAFVACDPEGYYLEWDWFRDTAENARLIEAIEAPLP